LRPATGVADLNIEMFSADDVSMAHASVFGPLSAGRHNRPALAQGKAGQAAILLSIGAARRAR
jgi:hypothetical protein